MTNTNTTPAAEAVERVAKAMWADDSEGYSDLHAGMYEDFQKQATAAIAAHTAYLWERAMSDEAVERRGREYAQRMNGEWDYDNRPSYKRYCDGEGSAGIEHELTMLLGPRPTVVGMPLDDFIAEQYDSDPDFAAAWDEIKKESTDD